MVLLGAANTRMKDFFDVWLLARGFTFEGATLARAITATFRRRKTPIPADVPLALTPGSPGTARASSSGRPFSVESAMRMGRSSRRW